MSRSNLTGSSRKGAGAPMASGLKKLRGNFIAGNDPVRRFLNLAFAGTDMQQ
jgi:hypothetical protein